MPDVEQELYRLIDQHFTLSDIRQLCFALSLDYEHLAGENKPDKIINLITRMRQDGRFPDLLQQCRTMREHVVWPDAPALPAAPERSPLPNPFGRTGRLTAPHYLPRPALHNYLFDELRKGSSLSLVGDSQTGKSSLLWHICQAGPAALARPAADFVYLSLELLRNDDDFFACVCEELGVPSLRGFRLARALRGRQVVLCLDEIEKMTWDGFTLELRTELRGLADGGDAPLTLVIASRSPLARLFPDSPQLTSPLAGLCTQVTMSPFTLAESQTLAAQYLAGSGLTLSPTAVERAWQQSGGHPARLQQALHAAFTEYLA